MALCKYVDISNCTFTKKKVLLNQEGPGGSIHARLSSVRISNSIFTQNKLVRIEGGAIFAILINMDLINCSFLGNNADFKGRAILASRCESKMISVINSFFHRCSAEVGGTMANLKYKIVIQSSSTLEAGPVNPLPMHGIVYGTKF